MKITLFNGNPDTDDKEFEGYLQRLSLYIKSGPYTFTLLNLRKMNIRYCIGCFGCWIKTPGECVIKDDSRKTCRAYINSDLVIFASPIIMGHTSALLKKAQDKLIPLIHPHFEFVQNETKHLPRYGRYPSIALLLGVDKDTDADDIAIIRNIYERIAANFKTSLSFVKSTNESVKEVIDAFNNI